MLLGKLCETLWRLSYLREQLFGFRARRRLLCSGALLLARLSVCGLHAALLLVQTHPYARQNILSASCRCSPDLFSQIVQRQHHIFDTHLFRQLELGLVTIII